MKRPRLSFALLVRQRERKPGRVTPNAQCHLKRVLSNGDCARSFQRQDTRFCISIAPIGAFTLPPVMK